MNKIYEYNTDFSEFLTETASSSLQLIPRIFAEQGVRGLMAVRGREGERKEEREREREREREILLGTVFHIGNVCVCVCVCVFPAFLPSKHTHTRRFFVAFKHTHTHNTHTHTHTGVDGSLGLHGARGSGLFCSLRKLHEKPAAGPLKN